MSSWCVSQKYCKCQSSYWKNCEVYGQEHVTEHKSEISCCVHWIRPERAFLIKCETEQKNPVFSILLSEVITWNCYYSFLNMLNALFQAWCHVLLYLGHFRSRRIYCYFSHTSRILVMTWHMSNKPLVEMFNLFQYNNNPYNSSFTDYHKYQSINGN